VLTIATLAFAGVAGIAYAQNVDPYEPTDDDIAASAREIYIAQGPSGPDYLAEDELRLLKRDARRVRAPRLRRQTGQHARLGCLEGLPPMRVH
jgi:hypothetical protein